MAQFMRGKQSGIQDDLSAGLNPELFIIDTISRFGINSQLSALAYDPVQSLLAAATNESQYGPGKIYVFGQQRVCITFTPTRASSIRVIHFCAFRLISVDSKNDLTVFDLRTKKLESSYSPPGRIVSIETDPTLDYVFIALQSGEVIAYDMDRQALALLRIPCLWGDSRRPQVTHIVALKLHPRDLGQILIAYNEGVILYSFKQNKALTTLRYISQRGAPGGASDPSAAKATRSPKLVHAVWHPIGTFVLTAHEDESLAIWDSKSGHLVHAMTLQTGHTNQPNMTPKTFGSTPGTLPSNTPISRVTWCCKKNSDDTGIVVAGGLPRNISQRGMSFVDLGPTPAYQTSSWQALTAHFEKAKDHRILATPPNTDVVDICLVPRSSPHYGGACDPIAIIALLSSGELTVLSFPSGYPISPTNQLHPSISFVSPFVTLTSLAHIPRQKWLGLIERRNRGPALIKGGAQSTHTRKRFEERQIFQTAHVDGTVRLWDAGHGDEIENQEMLQVDAARILRRDDPVSISQLSFAGSTGEFSVGMQSGETLIFRWGRNPSFGKELAVPLHPGPSGLVDIRAAADAEMKEGLLPLTLLPGPRCGVTALRTSEIGFVAVGYQDGSIAVVDLRGPALIYQASVLQLAAEPPKSSSKRSSFNKNQTRANWATVMEFGVMSIDGESYSSILLAVGTNNGNLFTFKLLPSAKGTFSVEFVGLSSLEAKVITIFPLNPEARMRAAATHSAVSNLREGVQIHGVLVAITVSGARIFKPAAAKGANKSWSDYFCDAAAVVSNFDNAMAIVGLFGDGFVRTFSIPGLKELSTMQVGHLLDTRRFADAIISPTGDIFGWTGPSEILTLNAWGSGQDSTPDDQLMNPELPVPSRPTISNIQWISGTQYFTPADLDLIVGGPDRPPSKRMLEQMRADELEAREVSRSKAGASTSQNQHDEGYWSYMQRQIQERTDRLNIMGDSMDRLEESSAGWAEDVSKFVSDQKKKAVMGVIGSKFGF